MKIEIFYIMFGLCLGFFFIYATAPPPKIILKYPTDKNIKNTSYVDENGLVYKYFTVDVPCKSNNAFYVLNKS